MSASPLTPVYFSAFDDASADRITTREVEWSLYHALLFHERLVVNETFLFHSRHLIALWSDYQALIGVAPDDAHPGSAELIELLLEKRRLGALVRPGSMSHRGERGADRVFAELEEHYKGSSPWYDSLGSTRRRNWVFDELKHDRYDNLYVAEWGHDQKPDVSLAELLRRIFDNEEAPAIEVHGMKNGLEQSLWTSIAAVRRGVVDAAVRNGGLERAELADEIVRRVDPDLYQEVLAKGEGGALLSARQAALGKGDVATTRTLMTLAQIVDDCYQAEHARAAHALAGFLPGDPRNAARALGCYARLDREVDPQTTAVLVRLPELSVLRSVGAKHLYRLSRESVAGREYQYATAHAESAAELAEATHRWSADICQTCRRIAGANSPFLSYQTYVSRVGGAFAIAGASATATGFAPFGMPALIKIGAAYVTIFELVPSLAGKVISKSASRRLDDHYVVLPAPNGRFPGAQMFTN